MHVGTAEAGRNAPYAQLAVANHAPMRCAAGERHDWIDYGVGHGDTKRVQGAGPYN
ncbi:hypothetical protein [Streptomyces griseofuscus]|uniref:hypothetical protein n=1 Tax=Streptomyces griseofuscus TaxID=146922 RepID=UPI00155A9F62|nr:hypothetical protein [Streptomyces griseofuscus]